MSTSTIQLPTSFVSDMIAQATALLSNLNGYLTTIIGILLAILVIEILIGAFRK